MTTQHGGSALTNADLAGAAADPQALDLKKAARIARNERCMGSGLIANLVAMAADAGVGMWTASPAIRSEEHTSELQSLMRISYAVFRLKKTNVMTHHQYYTILPL